MRLPIYVLVLAVVLAALTAGPAGADVPDNSVTSAKIVTGAIQAVDIANSAIKSNKIRNRAVTTSKIANSAVTTSKIANGAVSAADIAADAVTAAKIASGAVGSSEIDTDAVTSAEMLDGSVDTTELADAAVTTAKLAADIGVLSLGTGYSGGDQVLTGTMSFDATYTTGGEDVTTTLGTIRSVMTVPSKSGYVFEVVETSFATGSFKLKAMQGASTTGSALAEVTAGTDLSGVTSVRYQAIGQ